MSNRLLKLFSKDLIDNVFKSLHSRTGNYLRKREARQQEKRNLEYDQKYSEANPIQYRLGEIKINLYKESKLSRMIYDGFEQDEIDFVKTILRSGDVVIDIGANIGLFTLIAAKAVGNTGKLISFEPDPSTYRRLIENCSLNDLSNVDARNTGLSSAPGCLTFYQSQNGWDAWNSFVASDEFTDRKEIKIDVSTLDIELQSLDLATIIFVKIDVEGWEKYVLEGGRNLLQNYSPIVLMEFTDNNTFAAGYHVHELYDTMVDFGYSWFRIHNGALEREQKKLYYPYDNLVAVKDLKDSRLADLIPNDQ